MGEKIHVCEQATSISVKESMCMVLDVNKLTFKKTSSLFNNTEYIFVLWD